MKHALSTLRWHLSGTISSLLPEPDDTPKALAFAGLGFLLQAGLVLGITTADSLFLSRVGAQGLPSIYILQTAAMLLHTAAFVTLVKRFGIDRLFDGTLAVMILCGLVIWLLFTGRPHQAPFYYAVKLYTGMWYFGLYTLFWTFLDSYYDLTEAKRLYALFAAGSAGGAMIGGAAVSLLADRIDPGTFFLLWAVTALLTWPVLARIRQRWPKIDTGREENAQGGALREAMAGIRSLAGSRYTIALTGGFFMITVTATICDYEYMRIFSVGRDEAQLAGLFGRVTLAANLANMLITLFLFNPLVARFGVRNVALLQPVIFGAVFLWFARAPGMGAAIGGFLAYHALMMAIDINNGNLLVFGLPTARRKELRTLIEGVCLPAAAACAGLFLLVVAPGMSIEKVALIGLASAGVTFACNVVVRQEYVGAIAANLRSGWLDLSALTPRHGVLIGIEPYPKTVKAQTGATTIARTVQVEGRAQAGDVAQLLLDAADYSASERRLVEQLIVAMGKVAVPGLVEASESARYSVRGRSIALRALGRIEFVRLQEIASPLMLRTARRAYEFLSRYEALTKTGDTGAGLVVLRRINRDYPLLTLEIVLEALTIAGQLPPYEAISAALGGGPSRDRGYAVEMVEQGAGRELASLLAPWIAAWPPDRQLAYAREHELLVAQDEREALVRALASSFPLEAAAAAQALWERGEPEHLGEKLRDSLHPILAETKRVLSARDTNQDAGLTPVECVAAVMQVPQLAMFKFIHLEWLASLLPTAKLAVGECLALQGGPLDCAWIVVEGEIVVHRGETTRLIGPGLVAGERALTGERISSEQITAGEGLRAIILPVGQVLACAEAFPELGIELLRWRLAPP